MITVNMTKAREIKKDQLRQERKPLLEQLDIDYMRALESGNTSLQTTIVNKKQRLRDITADSSIASASTPDELKAVRPAVLDE